MELRKIAEKVWLDIYNNDTLIYNTFEEYWLAEFNKQNTMKTLQINLGLNNNPMNAEQVINYFATLSEYRLMAYIIKDKTFNGEVEPTFVALLEHKYTRDSKILSDVENWCSLFTQESIALVTDKMEVLAFNIKYEGDTYKFDSSLFEYIKL
ncbi:hypothetical protein elemo131C_phanotate44 [Flavobacterium phage vB_FspP_elemoC_13-1C]|nr:hypothetical protein elemo131C_phanotate44 [Flavobacterium phage vB_FspP_elemoC_13-1C]